MRRRSWASVVGMNPVGRKLLSDALDLKWAIRAPAPCVALWLWRQFGGTPEGVPSRRGGLRPRYGEGVGQECPTHTGLGDSGGLARKGVEPMPTTDDRKLTTGDRFPPLWYAGFSRVQLNHVHC